MSHLCREVAEIKKTSGMFFFKYCKQLARSLHTKKSEKNIVKKILNPWFRSFILFVIKSNISIYIIYLSNWDEGSEVGDSPHQKTHQLHGNLWVHPRCNRKVKVDWASSSREGHWQCHFSKLKNNILKSVWSWYRPGLVCSLHNWGSFDWK